MKQNLLKIAKRLKRFTLILSFAARHFWLSLFLLLILSLVIIGFSFYQYVIFFPRERMADSPNLLEVDKGAYSKLMELKAKESLSEGEYPSLFKKAEEETEEEAVD